MSDSVQLYGQQPTRLLCSQDSLNLCYPGEITILINCTFHHMPDRRTHMLSAVLQSLSYVQLFVTPWTAAQPASLSFTISQSLLKLMSVQSVMPSNNLLLRCPLLLLPSIFPSIRVFSNESAIRIRWPKYRNFSFSISPSNEYSGLISFRIDWLDLLEVQGTLKSLLQQHSSRATILQCSDFFMVQLSHLYMITAKTMALTRWTCVSKVMSMLFNTLSRFVKAFLPRSKCLLISWLHSPPAMILEPKKIKSVTVSIVSPSICHEVMGSYAMIFIFWMLNFKPVFSLSFFTPIKRLFSSSSLSSIRVVSSAYLRLLIFLPAVLIPILIPNYLIWGEKLRNKGKIPMSLNSRWTVRDLQEIPKDQGEATYTLSPRGAGS